MRSDFHGINIQRAATLADELARWVPQVAEISGDVFLAESLSELRCELDAQLESLSRTGSSLARAISSASSGLLAHRLAVDEQFKSLNGISISIPGSVRRRRAVGEDPVELARTVAEAQTIIDRQRLARATGHPTRTGDRDRLAEIFDTYIDDSATAATALTLALGGSVPAAHALGYTSIAEIEAEFDRVAQNMRSGIDPSDDVLPAGMYPDTYRTWIDQRSTKRSRTRSAFGPVGERLRVPGLLGREFVLPNWTRPRAVALDGWQATSALALHLGPVSSSWLGRSIAAGASGEWGFQAAIDIAEIAASDPAAALAMFNTLGARGTADIPHRLATLDVAASKIALPDLAKALASVSGHPDLGFSGAELIEADTRSDAFGIDLRPLSIQYVEHLLLAERFDARFLTEAALASLGHRTDRTRPRLPTEEGGYVDPRDASLDAIAMNHLGSNLVLALGSSRLADLLPNEDPETSRHRIHRLNDDTHRELAPLELVLLQVGLDAAATRVITNAIGSDPDLWQYLHNDPVIASGLSMMLSFAAPSYVHAPRDHRGFIETYHIALRGGSGGHVAMLDRELLRAETRTQVEADLAAGRPITIDLRNVGTFLGALDGTRSAVYDSNPGLATTATTTLAESLDVLSLTLSAVGLAPGPHSIAASSLALMLALFADGIDGHSDFVKFLLQERQELLDRPSQMLFDVHTELRSALDQPPASTAPLPIATHAVDNDPIIGTHNGSPIPLSLAERAADTAHRNRNRAHEAALADRGGE